MIDAPLIHSFEDPLPLDRGAAAKWLGGKGASVAQMTAMGLPVPPGFTLSTEVWRRFEATGALAPEVKAELGPRVARIEAATGARFGDPSRPLLLAVRSGAPTSMPGMLDTVLDVGVGAEVERGLAERYGAPRFARDVRRRFLESFATVVLGVPRAAVDALLAGRSLDALDDTEHAALLIAIEETIAHESGVAIPTDPEVQLVHAIEGVLRSWRGERAVRFRAAHGIDDAEGTGVTIQAMVFGNLPDRSGAGVVFSRNPSTGERALYGEWLREAQGEDVVSGRRTPHPLMKAQVRRGQPDRSLETAMPDELDVLRGLCARLEERYADAVDVEFTIEAGRVYALQCRVAKRTPRAAVRIAAEMVDEGAVDEREALARLDPGSLRHLVTPRLPDPEVLAERGASPVARGLAASPGAASGRVVLDAGAAAGWAGQDLVLVRAETSAEDVAIMRSVAGILTAAGGLTSHAAVVARAMGKPCVAGASGLYVDYANRRVALREAGGAILKEGDLITIDGARGLVYIGVLDVEPAIASEEVTRVLSWAEASASALVLGEANDRAHALLARRFGADGSLVHVRDPDELAALRAEMEGARLFVELDPSLDDAALRRVTAILTEGDGLLVERRIEGLGLAQWTAAGPGVWRSEDGSRAIVRCGPSVAQTRSALDTLRVRAYALVVPPLDVPRARLVAAQLEP
ncbi:MAG: PEP/pyruvate-binding domain-containing protein [Sandaracinaceae bacterium]